MHGVAAKPHPAPPGGSAGAGYHAYFRWRAGGLFPELGKEGHGKNQILIDPLNVSSVEVEAGQVEQKGSYRT